MSFGSLKLHENLLFSLGWKNGKCKILPFFIKSGIFFSTICLEIMIISHCSPPKPTKPRKIKVFIILPQWVSSVGVLFLFSGQPQTFFKSYFLRTVTYILWFFCVPAFRIKSHMSAGNTDFSTLAKGKNLKITGLYFMGCGRDTNYHCLAEMFYRLDPR